MTVSVCALSSQNERTAVVFISVSGDINLKLLKECFELGPFNSLHKPSPEDLIETAPKPEEKGPPGNTNTTSPQGTTGEVQYEMNMTQEDPCVQTTVSSQDVNQRKDLDQSEVTAIPSEVSEPVDTQACAAELQDSEVTLQPRVSETPNVFCIQLFVINKKFEIR
ncbi:unnamed protein product [Coregonus sp. 'balchen']|nr:unnamed protein product [Coregonus sp. 'balchen']